MKWISFNCRDLAIPSKKLALKRLLDLEPCDIIFLQETLGMAEKITLVLHSLKPGWSFHALDVLGRSGGIALGVNSHSIKPISAWGGHGYLGMDIFSTELGKNICIVNIYMLQIIIDWIYGTDY